MDGLSNVKTLLSIDSFDQIHTASMSQDLLFITLQTIICQKWGVTFCKFAHTIEKSRKSIKIGILTN